MCMRDVSKVVTVVLALLSWKFVGQNEKSVQIHDGIQSPVDMTDGNKPEHERSPVNMTERNKPQHARAYIKLNSKEELSFKLLSPTSNGSLSYDTVFLLVLIHMCRADVAALISTLYHHMCWAWSFIDPALSVISVIMVAHTIHKGKREKATLMEVKAKLENQRNQLKKQLKVVEADKEKNKQDLQSVEQEITEREKNYDKPEEELRKKENLLQIQWKLDQTEKDIRRQLLNTEEFMEPIDTLFTRRRSKDFQMEM